jgi:parvulin-like peptidyl-prolyl isomerase
MSIMRMRKFFSKPVKFGKRKRSIAILTPAMLLFIIIIIALLIGTYYSFGPPSRADSQGGPAGPKLSANVAVVDGKAISRNEYYLHLDMAQKRMGQQLGATQMRYVKTSVLESIIDMRLKMAAVKAEGIRISKADIEAEKDRLVEETKQHRYPDTKSLRDYLARKGMALEELDESIRSSLPDDDALKLQLQFDKLQEQVESQVSMADEELKDSFTEVKASHILITPEYMKTLTGEDEGDEEAAEAEESEPAEDEAADAEATDDAQADETDDSEAPQTELEAKISEEQAKEKAREFAEKLVAEIKAGADFAELAKKHSQDFGSASDGGDVGYFKRGRMVPEFEEAAFSTEPGNVTDPVETQYGFHIIKVEDKRQELPEDFEEQKEMYREQALAQEKMRVWRQYEQDLRERSDVQIFDAELKAYDLLGEQRKAEGIQYLEAAVGADPENATAMYELAQLYDEAGILEKAVDLLERVTQTEQGSRSPEAHFRLAELYEKQDRAEDVLQELNSASDWASAFTQGNYMMHMRLKTKFDELEHEELAEAEQAWMDDYMEHMAETNPMGGGMPMTIPPQ